MTEVEADSASGIDPVSGGDPAPVAAGESARRWLAAKWAVFAAISYLLLRPVLLTAIVADDFVNPFVQFDEVGVGVRSIVRRAAGDTYDAGHFNYLGQSFGGLVNGVWIVLMGQFGIRYSLIYSVTKFVVFVVTAVVTARVVRDVAGLAGRRVDLWRSRVIIAFLLFGTLQLHIGWSNDPVGSYPLSGYAAVALGLGGFSVAIRAMQSESARPAVAAALLLTAGVTYYEINVAAVAAAAPAVAVLALQQPVVRRSRMLARATLILGTPTVTVVILKTFFTSRAGAYGGTAVSADGRLFGTFARGIVSSLPGAGWPISRDYLGVGFEFSALALGCLIAAAVVALVAFRGSSDIPAPSTPMPRRSVAAAAAMVGLVGYGAGATLVQSITDKVQDESPRIGFVYNYYSVSATIVALMIATALVVARRRWLLVGLISMVAAVSVFQAMVNQQLMTRLNATVLPNRELLVAASERLDEDQRCIALGNWAGGGWPLYYEEFMIDGLQDMHLYYEGELFCSTILEPIP